MKRNMKLYTRAIEERQMAKCETGQNIFEIPMRHARTLDAPILDIQPRRDIDDFREEFARFNACGGGRHRLVASG